MTVEADRLEVEAPLRLHPEPHLRIGALDGAEGDFERAVAYDRPGGDFEMQAVELAGGQRAITMGNIGPSLSLPHQVEVGPGGHARRIPGSLVRHAPPRHPASRR